MNENLFDVLLYLFENYPVAELEDDIPVRDDLDAAGFLPEEVDDAFDWLRGTQDSKASLAPAGDHAIRLYSPLENARLPTDCQGFLHKLQENGVLTGSNREIVIDRLMALASEDSDAETIDVEQLKWVVMMVLSNQGDETACTRLEGLLHAEQPGAAH